MMSKILAKTYNRRDSQMVTHSSTSRPVQCLCMAERTGCPVFTDLWSYVQASDIWLDIKLENIVERSDQYEEGETCRTAD